MSKAEVLKKSFVSFLDTTKTKCDIKRHQKLFEDLKFCSPSERFSQLNLIFYCQDVRRYEEENFPKFIYDPKIYELH
jgi:hypothetical protein